MFIKLKFNKKFATQSNVNRHKTMNHDKSGIAYEYENSLYTKKNVILINIYINAI